MIPRHAEGSAANLTKPLMLELSLYFDNFSASTTTIKEVMQSQLAIMSVLVFYNNFVELILFIYINNNIA